MFDHKSGQFIRSPTTLQCDPSSFFCRVSPFPLILSFFHKLIMFLMEWFVPREFNLTNNFSPIPNPFNEVLFHRSHDFSFRPCSPIDFSYYQIPKSSPYVKFNSAKKVRATVGKNEAIYIPANWLYAVWLNRRFSNCLLISLTMSLVVTGDELPIQSAPHGHDMAVSALLWNHQHGASRHQFRIFRPQYWC